MALGVTLDLNAIAVLKEYYGPTKFEVAMFRNDPVLAQIGKDRIGGKYIPVPLGIAGSGAATADYQQYSTQVANAGTDISFFVTPGRLFAGFVLDPAEYLASKGAGNRAFISLFAMKAMFAMDDLRKLLSMCFYRRGYLEQGPVITLDAARLYVDVDPSTAMCLVPGSQVMFAGAANTAYRNVNAVVVANVANQQATGVTRVTFSSAYDATVAVGDQVMIRGGRDAGLLPNAPVGLGEWLPTVANRTGATWTTYIATAFYGVNRSIAPDRTAGQFVLQNVGAGENKTAAIMRGLKLCRRAGANPTAVVLNDDDYGAFMGEALANRSLLQNISGPGNKGPTAVTQGIANFQMSFSTNWLDKVYDSAYCPKGTAYVLTLDDLMICGLTNVEPVLGEGMPTNNEPGAPNASSAKEPTTNFMFLSDEMVTTSPIKLASGMGIQVDFNFIGNFIVKNPAHNAVVVFA
jgi:hypothetical protein